MKKHHQWMAWPALIIVVLDQLSKWIVTRSFQVHESLPVLKGFFNLVHVRNRGMAFGLMNRPNVDFGFYLLVAASLGAVVVLLIWFFRLKEQDRGLIVGLSMILGGAIGNLVDRIRFREVVDFLDFHIGSYHWPAFNVADSAITVGTFWVALCLIFQHRSSSASK